MQQIEPAIKFFFELVEKNTVVTAPLAFALKDTFETQRRLSSLISVDLSSLLRTNVDFKEVIS